MSYCVGLTGGIGSGKSSAARLFAARGAAVVDVDDISHALTAAGGGAIAAIRSAFGADAIAADGRLDRPRMRERVFADDAVRLQLEAILHPMIGAEARRQVIAAQAPYAMLVVPLLLEREGYRDLIRRVAVVDCPEAVQVARTMQRSAMTAEAVRAVMAKQLPRAQRLSQADDVIDNHGDEAALERQVATLHRRYLELAAHNGGR